MQYGSQNHIKSMYTMRELSDKLAITKLSHQLAITKTDIRNRSRHYRMIYYFAVRFSTFGHPDVVNPELFHIHSITSNMKIPSYQNEAQRDCPSISSALCSLWPNCNKCNITTWSAADCAIYLNDVIGPKHRYFGNVRWYGWNNSVIWIWMLSSCYAHHWTY